MKLSFVGKTTAISEALKEKTIEKMDRLSKFLDEDANVRVAYKVTKLENKIEVTFDAFKKKLRAEAKDGDMYAAIDHVVDNMEKQLRRLKNRIETKSKKAVDFVTDTFADDLPDYDLLVIQRKKFDVDYLEVEDAIVQMELANKDFFLFRDTITDDIQVVYKTKEPNTYGVIEPN